jgi:hypothetical protein
LARDPRFQRRRCNASRTDRDDRVDIAGRKIGTRKRLARDVDKQLLGAFEKRPRSLRPAAPLEVPFHRLDAVALAYAGVRKQARKRFELRVALRHHLACSLEDLVLMKEMWRNRGR